jgi:hypothetical protein
MSRRRPDVLAPPQCRVDATTTGPAKKIGKPIRFYCSALSKDVLPKDALGLVPCFKKLFVGNGTFNIFEALATALALQTNGSRGSALFPNTADGKGSSSFLRSFARQDSSPKRAADTAKAVRLRIASF